jgi:hypothetical protein
MVFAITEFLVRPTITSQAIQSQEIATKTFTTTEKE